MWDASPNGSLVQQPLAQVSSEARIPNNTIQYLSSTSSRDSWVFLDSIDPQSLRFSIKSKTSKNSSDSKSLKKMAHQILKINDIPIENPQRIEKLFSVSQLIIESASKNHEKTISWIHDQKREIRKLQKEILQFKNNIPEVIGVKCPICLKSFESMEYLDLHIYSRHQNYVDMWNSLRVPQNIQYSPDQNSISSIEGQNKKHGKKKRHLENMSVSENYSNISNYSSSNYVNRNNESKNYVNEYDPQAVPLILNEFKAEIEKTQKQTEQKMMNLLSQQISNFEMKIDEKMSTLRGDSLVDTIPSISTITTSKMINSDVTPTSSVIPNSKLIYNSSTQNSSINHNSNDVPSSSIFQKSNIVNSDILQNSDIPKNSRNNESSIFDLPTFSEDESSQLIEDSFEINKRRNNKGKDLSHLKIFFSVDSLNSIESINSINFFFSFNNNYSSNMSNSLSIFFYSLSNYGKNKKGRKQLKKSDNSFFEFSPNPSSLEETSNSYKSYSNDDTPVLAWQKKDFGDQLDLIPYVTNTTNTASNLEINSIPEKSDKTIENQNINQQKPKLEMIFF
ncbi:hypothetical protein TRFO_06077 [Tritrichomonas foetus]|uniref:C2H2-type domain-containing protein n=1 Tax=Tritrichomonas foetus TaxID=1144522 RepID=A0A1J4K5S2_9EUKA|nr:hypothetical protein TRFO_06077 [Tritrichomonas foetus]|eukprot:OHT05076.1 hypothetical protein TRFO_06077 [Tritrichomonas foetus]